MQLAPGVITGDAAPITVVRELEVRPVSGAMINAGRLPDWRDERGPMRRLQFSILAALLTTAGSMFAQSNPFDGLIGGALSPDPVLYAKQKAQWLARVEALPQDVDVLEGAAQFFIIRDRPLAQDLLGRARALEPDNPRWVLQLAHLHRMNAATRGDAAEALLALSEEEQAYAMASATERTLPTVLPKRRSMRAIYRRPRRTHSGCWSRRGAIATIGTTGTRFTKEISCWAASPCAKRGSRMR